MSGLVDTLRRGANFAVGKGYKTSGERKRSREARIQGVADARQIELDKVFASGQIPDEDDLKRRTRRIAAARRGSRANTVLTEDTLG